MKLLEKQNTTSLHHQAAREVLETAPLIMRALREVMRSHRTPDLSIPQFRILGFLHRYDGSGLLEVAEHIGLRPPTMSKTIDALVARGLVERRTPPEDRRRVTLSLTESGWQLWSKARQAANGYITDKLSGLTEEELSLISRAMEKLKPLFTKEEESDRRTGGSL